MIDQLTIGNKSSYDVFGASVKSRKISAPKKKEIKETVPFSNLAYDFTAINGEIYWEERELEYVLEMMADTPEELEEMKTALSDWLMNVMNEEIHDPFIKDFHFFGTFSEQEYDDDEGMEKTTLTVKFMAYPYKIANSPTVYTINVERDTEYTAQIENKSSHRIIPTIDTNEPITMTFDEVTYSLAAGRFTDDKLMLPKGVSTWIIRNLGDEEAIVDVSFIEEVF